MVQEESGQWTLDALDAGLQRADQLAQGKSPWTTLETRNVLRAYRSGIDDTAQPYGVTYPLEYGKDPKRKWRVDVVLHGRDSADGGRVHPCAQRQEEDRPGARLGADRYFGAGIMRTAGRGRRMYSGRWELS